MGCIKLEAIAPPGKRSWSLKNVGFIKLRPNDTETFEHEKTNLIIIAAWRNARSGWIKKQKTTQKQIQKQTQEISNKKKKQKKQKKQTKTKNEQNKNQEK